MQGVTYEETVPEAPRRQGRRFTLAAIAVAIALLAALFALEKSGPGATDVSSATNIGAALDRLANLPGLGAGTPGAAALSQAQNAVNQATAAATQNVTTPDQAVALANNLASVAQGAVAGVTNAANRAQANQGIFPPGPPPATLAFVCDILLAARARAVATIDALINAFPQLAPTLVQVRAQIVATISAQLAAFGCLASP